MSLEEMTQQFFDFWKRIGARSDPKHEWGRVVGGYSQPHRVHHVLAHIEHCLMEFEPVRDEALHKDEVEMSLLYHDFIYEVGPDVMPGSNEWRSAECAWQVCRHAGLPSRFCNRVHRFILHTKHHRKPRDADARLLVDIDLSILGQRGDIFDDYERGIRKEYAWVPEETFRVKRGEILRRFLKRRPLYCTPYFMEKYEKKARENLKRSLVKLKVMK